MPSSVVWTGPTSETIEAANPSAGGEKAGEIQPETKRQCGRRRASSGRVRGSAMLPQPCRLPPAHPAGRHGCRAVDRPVHSPAFLPAAPRLKVKGWGWVMRVGMRRKTVDNL